MDSPISRVLDALYRVNGEKPKKCGNGWSAKCPCHDDRRPSLSIREGEDRRALVRCHAGCEVENIVKALGLAMRDLMPPDNSDTDNNWRSTKRGRFVSVSEASGNGRAIYATAEEAIAALENKLGKWTTTWTYTDAQGNPMGVIVRWDTADGKIIRPVSRNGVGWIIGGMPAPRPLYDLLDLKASRRVYVAEGEKPADALRSIGLTATTSPHGAKSARQADWTPLAGKDVMILPDNDAAGAGYRDDVIDCLSKLPPDARVRSVRVVELPGLRDKSDAFDFIAARRAEGVSDDAIRAEIEALAGVAEGVRLDNGQAPISRYHPFPVEVLPEPVRSFVFQGARAIGCDAAYLALPMLSAVAAAIGTTRAIQLKRSWTEPAIVWTAIVGESGTQKTPAFRRVMQSIRKRQDEAFNRHVERMEAYERELALYEKQLTEWKRSGASESDPPTKPAAPSAERMIVSDTTVEALAPILRENPRGVLLARDELSGWFGSFDRYVGGKGGADEGHWLSMHNAESLTVDRKTGQPRTIHVVRAAVSITGGIQPGVLKRVLGRERRESGMAARILFAYPPRRAKRWTNADITERTQAAIETMFARLHGLQPGVDRHGDPCPLPLPLTPQAQRVWNQFYNEHGAEQARLTGDLAAAWSKLEAGAARLALIVHFMRWAAGDSTHLDVNKVDERSVAAGIALSRWFGREARRVYGMMVESDRDGEWRRLVEMIERLGGEVTVRDWQRARSHKTSGDAATELTDLDEAGYGRLDPAPQRGRGRPSMVFRLHAPGGSTDNNPPDEAESAIESVSESSEGPDPSTDPDAAEGDDGDWGAL